MSKLVEQLLNGSQRAVARLITMLEDEDPETGAILQELYPHTGRAHLVGITGPPGAGKSSLSDQLIKEWRKQNKTVGVIAVDPTSTFTGGAILGDRIRMVDSATDPGVFIRSMGTRGSLGGMSEGVYDAVKVLDAYGMDYILIETVGVGQSEIDIVKVADSTIVVMVPGLGDDIQAIKAGILEIGDILVVNKADRDGAERLVKDLELMVGFRSHALNRSIPVIKTVATTGEGLTELTAELSNHWDYLVSSGELETKRRERIKQEILGLVKKEITDYLEKKINHQAYLDEFIEQVAKKELDPYKVADKIFRQEIQ